MSGNPHRSRILRKALRRLDAMVKDARRVRPRRGFDRRAVSIAVCDFQSGGHSSDAYLDLDIPTFRKLVPLLRDLIKTELETLRRG